MGSDKKQDNDAWADEEPEHPVEVPRYYIARYPVTAAQFSAFVEDTGYKVERPAGGPGLLNHPVVWVSWHDALAYCEWLTTKLRDWPRTPELLGRLLREGDGSGTPWRVTLPSEAEWEKAARGSSDAQIFPWGPTPDPNCANYGETRIGTTSAVGCFSAGESLYGVQDRSGNVWEWRRSLWGTN